MVLISFQNAFVAIIQIFLMGAVGFLLVRRRSMDDAGLKVLSWLSVNVSFPFFIFYQIFTNFNPSIQVRWWSYPLINISLCLGGALIAASLASLFKKKNTQEWVAVSSFHNAGYIPLLLITMLPMGEKTQELYPYVLLTIIGFDLCLWSLGASLITHHQKLGISWKNFVNAPLISMVLAFLFVLLGLKSFLPEICMKPIKVIGDSALSIAMLTIGGNLALTHFKKIYWKQIGGAVLIKLLILPTLALIFLCFVKMDGPWALMLMIQACMPSSITLSIIARYSDNPNQSFINQTIFVTHLLCCLTIPFFLGLYGRGF